MSRNTKTQKLFVGVGANTSTAQMTIKNNSNNESLHIENSTNNDISIHLSNPTQDYCIGIDNSNANALTISDNTTLGASNNRVVIKEKKIGIETGAPAAKLHIKQAHSAEAISVLRLEQIDIDQPAIDFYGTEAANAINTISTHKTPGALYGFVQININGTKLWLPAYQDPTA
ncbi:MAG: hypothetical protein V3S79_06155 [Candidatus Thermoplasmatota archaeon]